MARPKAFTREQVRDIRSGKESRWSYAHKYDVQERTIASIQLGYTYRDTDGPHRVENKSQPAPLPSRGELLRMQDNGHSAAQLAEQYGTTKATILGRIQRERRARNKPKDIAAPKPKTKPPRKAKKPREAKPKPAPKPIKVQPAPIDPAKACNVCGQDHAREGEDLCNGCASKVKRVDGFGDGPLPHYEGKAKQAASQMGRKAAQTRWLQANSNAIRKRTEAA